MGPIPRASARYGCGAWVFPPWSPEAGGHARLPWVGCSWIPDLTLRTGTPTLQPPCFARWAVTARRKRPHCLILPDTLILRRGGQLGVSGNLGREENQVGNWDLEMVEPEDGEQVPASLLLEDWIHSLTCPSAHPVCPHLTYT